MYDSLLLLIVMALGVWLGIRAPRWLKLYKGAQSCAVVALMFVMGASIRSFAPAGGGVLLWFRGAVIAIAATAGSVIFAGLYRKYLHKGEPL